MIREVLSHYHLPVLSGIGLLLFMAVFCGALAWVFRKGSTGFYASMQAMPFEDENAKGAGQ